MEIQLGISELGGITKGERTDVHDLVEDLIVRPVSLRTYTCVEVEEIERFYVRLQLVPVGKGSNVHRVGVYVARLRGREHGLGFVKLRGVVVDQYQVHTVRGA